MKLLLLVSVLFVGANAHLCLLSPKQRGTVSDLNTAGANDCLLTDAPCGKRDAAPAVEMKAGSNATIIFQKNLDHYNSKSPGSFEVWLWKDANTKKQLKTIPDTAPPNGGKQWLYTEMIAIPDEMGARILQVVYITKNPEAPADFYQCADVMLK